MNAIAIGDAGTAMTASFTALAGELTSAIGSIAPIAIGVMGVMLVWKIGTKFFKNVAK